MCTTAISYVVTNNMKLTRTLTTVPTLGISQNTSSGNCSSPFVLAPGQSCTLALTINGVQIPASGIHGGPAYLSSSSVSFTSIPGAISCTSLSSMSISCLVALNDNMVGNPTLITHVTHMNLQFD